MTAYRKMYAILCAAASAAIEIIERQKDPDGAAVLLRNVLLDAEERYIRCAPAPEEDKTSS